MRVLFVGKSVGQPLLMQNAMRRRGHEVFAVDPYAVLRGNRLLTYFAWHSGAWGMSPFVERHLSRAIGSRTFDVTFVDNGEMISPSTVQILKMCSRRVALFNRDNPFVSRDGSRWRTLLSALPHYDIYVTPRQSTADRAPIFGAERVLRVSFFADEVQHRPHPPTREEAAVYGSPVSFVGSWFPERGPFMETLLRRGVPLRIVGNRWRRAANYEFLKHVIVPGYLSSEQYSAAVRSCQIAIGMLSKGNEDLHTSRSLEIPAMSVVLCADRTSEHLAMYRDGQEAVFWSSAEECADQCIALLKDPERLRRVAEAGRARVVATDCWTEQVMERILLAAHAVEH